MNKTLFVNEIFRSIQGESSWAGLPCLFIRLAGCDLRCRWCDTEYAFHEGRRMSLEEILAEVRRFGCNLVEITGGEPLLQEGVHGLIKLLLDEGHQVLIETGGHRDIRAVDPRAILILDLKCPDSGMSDHNRWENLPLLRARDEIKFVLSSRRDFDWARSQIQAHQLLEGSRTILFSPVWGVLDPRQLAEWILEEGLSVRLQLQLHKIIWGPSVRGV